MKKIRSFFEKHPYIALSGVVTVLVMIMFFPYLFTGQPFTLDNDALFEYKVMGEEWLRLVSDFVHGKGLPMYSWNTFLGTDFYAAEAFYETSDFFLYLNYLIHDIDKVFLLESIVLVYISAWSMYLYLKEFGIRKEEVRQFTAVMYAVGGWATLMVSQYLFHRFYAFLPILLYSYEHYIRRKKALPIVLITALLFTQNYCLMWPASVFFLIYCVAREAERKVSAGEMLKDFLQILGFYVIGLLLSAAFFLPAALYIMSNERVGTVTNHGVFWPLKVYFGFLLSFITSPHPVHVESTIFYLNDNGYAGWYTLIITILPFVGSLCYIRRKENRMWLAAVLILVAAALIKPLSSLMYGMSDPTMRWTFVLQMLLQIMAARYFDGEREYGTERKLTIIYLLLYAVDFALLFPLGYAEPELHHTQIRVLIACFVLAVVISLLDRKSAAAAAVVSVLEVTVFCGIFFDAKYIFDPNTYRQLRNDFAYMQDIDEDMLYRYYIPMEDVNPAYLNLNFSLTGGFMSTKTYNSTYDSNVDPFLRKNEQYTIVVDISHPSSTTALGCKYWLVYDAAELPQNMHFEPAGTVGDYQIFQNMEFRGFGYTMEDLAHTSELQDLSRLDATLFVDQEDFDLEYYRNGEAAKFNVTEKANNYMRGWSELTRPNILCIAVPNNKGWKVTVDGVPAETISVNGGFMGICLESGWHDIQMSFVTPGLKYGILMTGVGFLLTLFALYHDHAVKKRG